MTASSTATATTAPPTQASSEPRSRERSLPVKLPSLPFLSRARTPAPAASPSLPGGPAPQRQIEAYPQPDPWIRLGVFIIVGTLGSLLLYAAFAGISGAIIGPGIVAVESNIKAVQHLDGGIVAELNVKNGDRVQKDQVLVRLDDTSARANLGIIMSRLNELLIQRARLEAEHKGLDDIEAPPAILEAAKTDPRTQAFLDSQRSLFEARKNRMGGQVSLLRDQRRQLQEQIIGLTSNRDAAQRQVELIRREMESVRPLLEQGLYTVSRMLALGRETARLDGEVGRLNGDIARLKGAISETDGKIAQLDKDTMQQVFSELREAQGKIAELEEQKVAITDRLKRIDIRAPATGFVHNLASHTVSGVIQPAITIMEIIPENDRLIVEARVSPNDIEQVSIGQEATVRFPAFHQQTTPVLDGKVTQRSAASLLDKATNTPYFRVIVEVAASELPKLGEGKTLIPGMQAEVYIQTSQRTILSYLVKPFTDQFERAFRER